MFFYCLLSIDKFNIIILFFININKDGKEKEKYNTKSYWW